MKYSQGITLIEVLVAILLFSGGLLGVAAMQAQSLKMAGNSSALSLAVMQASNIIDRMQANPQGINAGSYNAISGNSYTKPTCATTCTPAQIAAFDAFQWSTENSNLLDNGAGTVTNVAGTNLYTVVLSWIERGKDADDNKSYQVTFMPYQP